MKTRRHLLWFGTSLLGLALYGCTGGGGIVPLPNPGDTQFLSAPVDNGGYLDGYGADAEGGRATPEANATQPTDPQREIEEADIVKVVGTTLYALNQYRGLYVIDITDPDQATIQGHLDVFGYPVEMYVRDGRAYIVLSDYFRVWASLEDPEAEIGSAIVAVDVSVPSSPLEISRFWIPGYITDTRAVGDVIYGVSNRYSWFRYYYPSGDWDDTTHLLSINIADPDDIHEVDRAVFPRSDGWDNHVHVTSQAIYVASSGYGEGGYVTDIRYVNISDPQGWLSLGANIQLPGYVQDRWQMDEHNGVFRVAMPESWWGNSAPKIHSFRVNSPTSIQHISTLDLQLPRPEALTAVRFDAGRAYLVTYERVDPLFVVDLSDPEHPVQAGELEMPGWLDHIVPRGDRLVAFGHDDSGGTTTLAISLFNVANAFQPTLLSRVSAGEGWGWLTDERDNYDKLFKVLDSEGLILLPFMQCGGDYWRCTGGVQLVDFSPDSLVKRGTVLHEGYIRRALVAQGRLLTLSDQRLQVLDISNRDQPTKTADIALSRNVNQFTIVNGVAVQLVGDWWVGTTSLVIMPLGQHDLGQPLAEIPVDAPYARMFTKDNNVFLLHRDLDQPEQLKIQAFDLTDPAQPLLADEITLDGYSWWYYGYYWDWWWWGWYYPRADEVVQAGDALVLHQVRRWSWCDECEDDRLLIVDTSDPYNLGAPQEIALTNRDWVTGLQVAGQEVRFTHYKVTSLQNPNGQPLVRYFLNRLDVSNPANAVLEQPINVPGVLLGSDLERGLVYTEDFQYNGQSYGFTRSVNVLALAEHHATLRGRVVLPEDTGRLVLQGERAFSVRNRWWYDEQTEQYHNESSLMGVNLSNMFFPTLLPETALPVPYASLYDVVGGHAVIGTWWYVSGLMVYDVSGNMPSFERHVRTQGWVSDLYKDGNDLYVATGPYGVQKLSF